MDPIDEDYKKSQQQYVESQKILIENIKLSIENDKNMIYIHKKALSNNIYSLTHEEIQLEKYLELYPYLNDNLAKTT